MKELVCVHYSQNLLNLIILFAFDIPYKSLLTNYLSISGYLKGCGWLLKWPPSVLTEICTSSLAVFYQPASLPLRTRIYVICMT